MTKSKLLGRSERRDPTAPAGDPRKGGTAVRTGGAVQGVNTIPRRGRLNALLLGVAVLAIAALVALLVWVGPLGFGGAQTKGAVPPARAGTAVIHDDPGSVHTGLRRATPPSTTTRAT